MSAVRLQLRDLTVRLGSRAVVDRISLDLGRGSLVAIVGPNGAGKTSALRAIVGLLPFDGSISLDGVPIRMLDRRERARRLAYLPQGHAAYWAVPARDIVALGRFPHGRSDPTRLAGEDAEAVEAAMRMTDTISFADRPVTALSGGERARIALARVFAVGAPTILADEPTASLDPRHQLDVARALRRGADTGALVIAVTHDLGLAARFADLIAVLDGGRLVAFGPPPDALAPGILRDVFGIDAFRTEHDGRPVLVPWA